MTKHTKGLLSSCNIVCNEGGRLDHDQPKTSSNSSTGISTMNTIHCHEAGIVIKHTLVWSPAILILQPIHKLSPHPAEPMLPCLSISKIGSRPRYVFSNPLANGIICSNPNSNPVCFTVRYCYKAMYHSYQAIRDWNPQHHQLRSPAIWPYTMFTRQCPRQANHPNREPDTVHLQHMILPQPTSWKRQNPQTPS